MFCFRLALKLRGHLQPRLLTQGGCIGVTLEFFFSIWRASRRLSGNGVFSTSCYILLSVFRQQPFYCKHWLKSSSEHELAKMDKSMPSTGSQLLEEQVMVRLMLLCCVTKVSEISATKQIQRLRYSLHPIWYSQLLFFGYFAACCIASGSDGTDSFI